jgi:hypothetical protein
MVNDAVPETAPKVAVISTEPVAALLARPAVPALLLIVDTAASEELQCADTVRSCVLPSL